MIILRQRAARLEQGRQRIDVVDVTIQDPESQQEGRLYYYGGLQRSRKRGQGNEVGQRFSNQGHSSLV